MFWTGMILIQAWGLDYMIFRGSFQSYISDSDSPFWLSESESWRRTCCGALLHLSTPCKGATGSKQQDWQILQLNKWFQHVDQVTFLWKDTEGLS